jgi:putative cell wall-binding protein
MTRINKSTRRLRRSSATLIGLGGALLLAACASTPPVPTVALSSAKQAIAVADQTRVADAASPELSEARDKLAAAQSAVQDKRMVDAERLAVESRVDAELATAKITASKDRAVNDEIIHSTETMSQEMQRNSGVK